MFCVRANGLAIRLFFAFLISLTASCGAGPSPRPEGPPPPHWSGPLVLLSPWGADVIIDARPSVIWASPPLRRVALAFVDEARVDRYRDESGVDLRTLEEVVAARGRAFAVLALTGPFRARDAVRAVGERMLPVEASSSRPFERRVGHYRGGRRDVAALDDDRMVVITGSPNLAGGLLDRAQGSPASTSAWETSILALFEPYADAPFVLAAPRPLDLPVESGVGLLLAREETLVIAASPEGEDGVGLVADFRGEFPSTAESNFRQLVASLAETDLGAAIGMRDVLANLVVETEERRIVLRTSLPAAALASGLGLLFGAEIEEMVGDGAASLATESRFAAIEPRAARPSNEP